MSKHNETYAQLRRKELIATQNELAVWAVLSVVITMGVFIFIRLLAGV